VRVTRIECSIDKIRQFFVFIRLCIIFFYVLDKSSLLQPRYCLSFFSGVIIILKINIDFFCRKDSFNEKNLVVAALLASKLLPVNP